MSNETITLAGEQFTYESLFQLTGGQLVKIHNTAAKAVGKEPTKRFGDKLAGVKRTWAVLQATQWHPLAPTPLVEQTKAKEEPKVEVAAPKAEKPAKVAKEKKEREPRGKYFMFPARPTEEQKEIKENTMRGILYRLMSRSYGATFEQLYKDTWETKIGTKNAAGTVMTEEIALKTTYEAIRLVHYFNGFGIYHAANDHLFVWSTQAELKDLKAAHEPKVTS
jgi:hypothetical protein